MRLQKAFSLSTVGKVPVQIVTDNGPEITSMISKALQASHNCKFIF